MLLLVQLLVLSCLLSPYIYHDYLSFYFSLVIIALIIFLKKRKSNKVEKEPNNEMEMNNKEMNTTPSVVPTSSIPPVANHKQLKDITILDRLGGGNVSSNLVLSW